jgi:3-isopropylmalate/(R)-2-methylmalate dehydratase large subunit
MAGRTLFEKVWDEHVVVPETQDTPAVLYVDLHLTHEVTSPEAFNILAAHGLTVRRPDLTLATLDHATPTVPVRTLKDLDVVAESSAATQIRVMIENCRKVGIRLLGFDSDHRGIVHVIGPELGITQPGKTIVCGDSHTSTHGAFGALAFGIGTTEVAHVLATQCLLQRKPKTLAINITGKLGPCVTAKDIILALIGRIGVGGGTGYVIEYRGATVTGLTMEERMTVCNMSIEAGARAGMVGPDDVTIEYLAGRPMAPQGTAWDAAVKRWRALPSDPDATFDREVSLDVDRLSPMITFGTNPGMVVPIADPVPAGSADASFGKSLHYMGIEAGRPMLGRPVNVVFIGSCTNSRLSDLRQAADVFRGRRVPASVRVLVVPGSQAIKKRAEEEGLDKVFTAAGAEWRESGCSMCIGMNGDIVGPGQLCVSTSNRNFEGRQGMGARTVLASPFTAAAAAVTGRITDPRVLLAGQAA